jgi:hypothetical protein
MPIDFLDSHHGSRLLFIRKKPPTFTPRVSRMKKKKGGFI